MKLLSGFDLSGLTIPNRVIMAPMTRSRAVGDGLPHPAAATYYAQRASAGLIITEGTQVSDQGRGYVRTPGIHTKAQIAGWKKVTDAVHAEGGRIFVQLWHVGRVSHPDFQNGEPPIAPSAITAEGDVFTPNGPAKCAPPRALETNEIPALVEQFVDAARCAKQAGFDGVELHGANGYLLDQFLRDSANQRTDRYGGTPQNRIRFSIEVAEAVGAVWGAEAVGYRVSPAFAMYSMSDSAPVETFTHLASALNGKAAYLHVVEPVAGPAAPPQDWKRVTPYLRREYRGALMVNGGYDRDRAERALVDGEADLVSFGAPFIANSDLPRRIGENLPLSEPNPDNIYQGEEDGYIDYPALD